MKVFVTGVGGQLGHDVINELAKRGHACVGSDLAPEYSGISDGTAVTTAPYVQLDITDSQAVSRVIEETAPDVIIHCAAWTAVDLAEDEDKIAKVRAINVGGTENIARACRKIDAKMIYLSTDYVFNGQGTTPWEPDCKYYQPLNVYGKTKLDGELAVSSLLEKYFIVRIAWVFGANGNNFIKTMLNVGKTHGTLRVVNDQIGTPTYSWYDFTKEIFRQAAELGHTEYSEDRLTVLPVTTAEYGLSKAARPFNSRLDKSKLAANGFSPLATWQDALHRYLMQYPF